MMGMGKLIFAGYLNETTTNSETNNTRTNAKARAIGKEGLDKITDACYEQILRSDCYIHGDSHVFNMLVESNDRKDNIKEDDDDDDDKGSSANTIGGDVAFIDWEFSHCGAMGNDLGWVSGFPIACLLAHAMHGDQTSVENIQGFLDVLWENYSASVDLDDKDLSIEDLYRQVMGSLGRILGASSAIGLHTEFLPIEEGNDEEMARVRESLGVLSLGVYEIAFLDANTTAATIGELRQRFGDAVQNEVRHLAPPATTTTTTTTRRPSKKRRSSLLRTSGRRVSDAHSYYSIVASLKRGQSFYEDLDTNFCEESGVSFCEDSTELRIDDDTPPKHRVVPVTP